jgi:anti-sigma-K factor RskA
MNIDRNVLLLEALAQRYAVGSMQSGARRRLLFYARNSTALRLSIARWQDRLAGLLELVPAVQPPATAWGRIEQVIVDFTEHEAAELSIGIELRKARAALGRFRRVIRQWQALAACALACGLFVIAFQRTAPSRLSADRSASVTYGDHGHQQPGRHVDFVAVLADDRLVAHLLLIVDPELAQVVAKPIRELTLHRNQVFKLWLLAPTGSAELLGQLDALGSPLRTEASKLMPSSVLAVSLEPKDMGHSGQNQPKPVGPFVYTGRLLKTAS